MTDFPIIRVGIDWDNNGVIDYDDAVSDPLNIFPDNAILRDDQTLKVNGGETWVVTRDINDFSEYCYLISPGGTGTRGIVFSTKTNYYTSPTVPGDFKPGSVVLANGTYTLSLLIKAVTGSFTATVQVYDEAWFETAVGLNVSSAQTITSTGYTRFDVTFTITGGPKGVHIRVTQASNAQMKISYRAALISGSTALAKFNDGTLNPYENVTADVMQANWQLGRTNPDDVFPSEGTLTLKMRNFDRKYSPENTTSVLYGKLKKNRKVVIEVQHPSSLAWITMWVGWTSNYEVDIGGTKGSLQAIISANQGIFRLNDMRPVVGVQENIPFLTVLDTVLTYGWIAGNTRIGNGDRSYVDKDAYFENVTAIRAADTGIIDFPTVGDGWDENTSATDILRQMLEVERGFFYLDRNGKFKFDDRWHYVNGGPLLQDNISIDTNANDGDYKYGDSVYNVINVSYYPKEEVITSIWKTKQPIIVNRVSRKDVDVTFAYEEGSKITVKDIQIGSSSIVAKTRTGTVVSSSNYNVTAELKNSAATLTIRNYSGQPLYFTIDLFGTRVTSFGNQTYNAELADYSTNYASYQDEGRREKQFNNKLIADEDMAVGIGDYLLARYGLPRSLFKNVKLASRDTTWLTRQLELTLSSYITLSEYQSAFSQDVVIVGEKHSWRQGILESEFVVTPPEFYPIDTLTNLQNSFYVGY